MKIINILLVVALFVSVNSSCKKSSVGDSECKPSFEPFEVNSNEALSVVVLGDQGCGNENARRVAELMNDYVAEKDASFILGVGDNIYQSGVESVSDPKFKTHFEDMFNQKYLDIPFYLTLGNHDYEGSINAQIDYSQVSERWNMPAAYYAFSKNLPTGETVLFVAIDTYELLNSDGTGQLEWLSTKLNNGSKSHYIIVFGHHPLYNNGNYGDHHELIEKLAPLFDRHNVNLYLAGHEHNIQYLARKDKTHYIVNGSGCKLGVSECGDNTIYNANQLGFTGLRITRDRIIVESILIEKGLDYAYAIR